MIVDRRFRDAYCLHHQGWMMEAVRTSETSVDNHFTRQYNPEDNSEHHEKIPGRNSIYAHAQDFAMSDEFLLATLKPLISQQVNKQQTTGFHVFMYTRHL
jgi:hypothetical protein